jgi:hypothetical protein
MKFMRCTAGHCLLDHRRYEGNISELEGDPVENKLAQSA